MVSFSLAAQRGTMSDHALPITRAQFYNGAR
jgi:hypothetical protein